MNITSMFEIQILYISGSQTVRHTSLGRRKLLFGKAQGKYLYCILDYRVFILILDRQ
jgi:hypothetical protein